MAYSMCTGTYRYYTCNMPCVSLTGCAYTWHFTCVNTVGPNTQVFRARAHDHWPIYTTKLVNRNAPLFTFAIVDFTTTRLCTPTSVCVSYDQNFIQEHGTKNQAMPFQEGRKNQVSDRMNLTVETNISPKSMVNAFALRQASVMESEQQLLQDANTAAFVTKYVT